jgi:hypothetical protein
VLNKQIKLGIAGMLIASSFIFAVPAEAQGTKDLRIIPIIVNGHKVKFPDTEPYIDENGRTMVPVRFVSEKLGGTVNWNDQTQTVSISSRGKEISLPVGSEVVKVDGKEVTLDTSAVLFEGRTMVPLRFVSEVLSSTVTWDEGAHSVKVTDPVYQAKADTGEIGLDLWGRELSKDWDANWNKVSDLPDSFYELPILHRANQGYSSREFWDMELDWVTKDYVDLWAEHIRAYYAAQLNVDYRTIDGETFADTLLAHMQLQGREIPMRKIILQYVDWIKENEVIVKGYADPENSMVRYEEGAPVLRTRFKFKVKHTKINSEVFLDNWEAGEFSTPFPLKTGAWYDGYADVFLFTHHGNYQERYYALSTPENMFIWEQHKYEEVVE